MTLCRRRDYIKRLRRRLGGYAFRLERTGDQVIHEPGCGDDVAPIRSPREGARPLTERDRPGAPEHHRRSLPRVHHGPFQRSPIILRAESEAKEVPWAACENMSKCVARASRGCLQATFCPSLRAHLPRPNRRLAQGDLLPVQGFKSLDRKTIVHALLQNHWGFPCECEFQRWYALGVQKGLPTTGSRNRACARARILIDWRRQVK